MSVNATANLARKQNFRSAKVMLIDDSLDHLTLMVETMKRCLPEVQPIAVHTREGAVTYLSTCLHQEWKLPKLILLDVYMPKREDGWRILRQIKEMPAPISHIPVVLLSHSAGKEDILEAYDRGGASYIVKPLTTSEWLSHFQHLRTYWWETVTLPQLGYRF